MKKVSSNNVISALVAGILMVAGNSALAATQGTAGATSTGDLTITADVTYQVQISGLSDMTVDYAGWDGISDLTTSESVCVWSNANGGHYNITATGSGSSRAFEITGPDGTLPYAVEWTGGGAATALTATTAAAGMTGANHGKTCSSGGPTANLDVIISAANLSAASAGTYTGTLTLLVAPE